MVKDIKRSRIYQIRNRSTIITYLPRVESKILQTQKHHINMSPKSETEHTENNIKIYSAHYS